MPDLPPLNADTIWRILNDDLDDAIVNQLVWHHLGYRYDEKTNQWDTTAVSTEWLEDYPEPPNFIESRPATVKLTRSIPKSSKQLLKERLGFEGYKVGELVPRLTRRATTANWLLSHLRDRETN